MDYNPVQTSSYHENWNSHTAEIQNDSIETQTSRVELAKRVTLQAKSKL